MTFSSSSSPLFLYLSLLCARYLKELLKNGKRVPLDFLRAPPCHCFPSMRLILNLQSSSLTSPEKVEMISHP